MSNPQQPPNNPQQTSKVIFSVYSCFQILNSKTASPDEKKYAQSTITLIAGGAMGYFAGKTNNKN